MKESITIKNFGGLKSVTIPLNSINIFIGKQASGKSVTAKLIYFFRKAFEDIFDAIAEDQNTSTQEKGINREIEKRFIKYFPIESWSKSKFFISYEPGTQHYKTQNDSQSFELESISIERRGKESLKVDSSKLIEQISLIKDATVKSLQGESGKQLIQKTKFEDDETAVKFLYHGVSSLGLKPLGFQIFIPAGRSFFSNIQKSLFSILAEGNSIDPFIIEFGSLYTRAKNNERNGFSVELQEYIQEALSEIAGAKYLDDKTGEYLIHKDGRKIHLLFCSSGQQEILPLALILKNFIAMFGWTSTTFYIEEPEAHLFPSAQKKIVEMIAAVHNISKDGNQMIITTHSPYVLTSFNNLLQAGHLLEKGTNKKKLFKIVPEYEILKPGELNAFAFQDGGVVSLIDEETGLISAELLDQVSEEISVQFDELLNL